jgi:hypothetical protein
MLGGLIIGGLGATNLAPLLGMSGYSWNQFATAGAVCLVMGVITELARRNRATDL